VAGSVSAVLEKADNAANSKSSDSLRCVKLNGAGWKQAVEVASDVLCPCVSFRDRAIRGRPVPPVPASAPPKAEWPWYL
jgi:hypothetical protein